MLSSSSFFMSFFKVVEAITFAVTECQWKIVIQQLV
nr:MAG TPA: hypothetical protein [Caudoviricetes sp.]